MNVSIWFIFLLPLFAPIVSLKVFGLSGRQTFVGFIAYYNLWLYFLAFDLVKYYFATFIYLLVCTLLLVGLLYYLSDEVSSYLGSAKLNLSLFAALLIISMVLNYEGLQWFSINILLMQCICIFVAWLMSKKRANHEV
ncbi:hypothetical protein PSECIP111854_01199 [Pseudoalteromonas sp. CIP111854]|uniref:Uncharacterized protein n=1 Tax=Pseudoalteromonas holothuriae TaxID=2963714 RepID=A0A9W4VPB3_9GAMM|nr:hypothetical protein PSECIP111854_01199 [Pseudoalteromonas sp. CIP111854]